MSAIDATCLRCGRYAPLSAVVGAVPPERGPDDCQCVHPRPSVDGENVLGFPEGFDWRAHEYALALAMVVAHNSGT